MTKSMIFRYGTVSLAATSVDLSVFHLLGFWNHPLPNGAAALLSASCGAWVSWTLNRRWVFGHSDVTRWKAGSRYLAGVLLCIALNATLVALCCDALNFPRMTGRVISAISAWGIIYWFNRRVVFRV